MTCFCQDIGLVAGADLVLGVVWQWASLRLAGGELGAGQEAGIAQGKDVGSSGNRVDGIRAGGAYWELEDKN